MKRIWLLACVILATAPIVRGQTITLRGNVISDKGAVLPFVLVQDEQIKTADYADSMGNFSIKTELGSKLKFSLNGYADTVLAITQDTKPQVMLRYDGSVKGDATTAKIVAPDVTVSDAFSGHMNTVSAENTAYSQGGQMQFDGAGSFPMAKEKEEARGSRYLFAEWGPGSVVNTNDVVIKDPAYVFNYDKMTGNLVVTHDKTSGITVDRDQIKSFTIVNDMKQPLLFERILPIDENHFAQVLAEGGKYKILEIVTTKFIKSNYQTNGITESGNQFDEYKDETNFYVFNVQTQKGSKFSLKKKSIKDAFGGDGNAESFLNTHKGDIDEGYLKELGDAVNK